MILSSTTLSFGQCVCGGSIPHSANSAPSAIVAVEAYIATPQPSPPPSNPRKRPIGKNRRIRVWSVQRKEIDVDRIAQAIVANALRMAQEEDAAELAAQGVQVTSARSGDLRPAAVREILPALEQRAQLSLPVPPAVQPCGCSCRCCRARQSVNGLCVSLDAFDYPGGPNLGLDR